VNPLNRAILDLLPAINAVTVAHRPDEAADRCLYCTPASKRECPHLWLAAAALDLVITADVCRCPRSSRSGRQDSRTSIRGELG
jgi:hypothetical protein